MLLEQSTSKYPSVFLVSSGRSGTTLLVSILNASKQICFPYESDFLARAFPFYQDKTHFEHHDYEQIAVIFQKSSIPAGWGMTQEYLTSYLKEKSPQTFADVNSAICEAYHKLEKTEDLLWGIKAPVLIASAKQIFAVFPQTKIIHIVRDGRDVYLSYKNIHEKSKVKFGPKGIVANALFWVDGLRRIEELPKTQIYEFRYEDLLQQPQEELKNLCEFIDIEYTPSMHSNFQNADQNKNLVSQEMMDNIHTKLRGELDAKNLNKYLTKMSKLEQFIFELFTIPYLQNYNYQIAFPFLSSFLFKPLRGIAYFGARKFNDWRYSQRDRIVSTSK